jgi:hypothetical protein
MKTRSVAEHSASKHNFWMVSFFRPVLQEGAKEPGLVTLKRFGIFDYFCGINTQFKATLLYKPPWRGWVRVLLFNPWARVRI